MTTKTTASPSAVSAYWFFIFNFARELIESACARLCFIFLVPVEHASLRNNGIFKPNPYVELSIDNKSIRKTEIVKHTYLPKWNEDFTVLVTPVSDIVFRVLDRSSFLKDSLLGERTVQLGQILEHYNGRLENLELNMDLLGALKPEGRSKSGELVVVLNGLKIDNVGTNGATANANSNNGAAGAENASASPPVAAINSRSSILSGGIRARMRLRSTPSNSSTTSNNHNAGGDIAFFGPQTMADLRNARLVPSERRHNEYVEQQAQHRTSSNMIPVASSCGTTINRTNNSNWDQSQALVPCSNGVSPNQRSFMVSTLVITKAHWFHSYFSPAPVPAHERDECSRRLRSIASVYYTITTSGWWTNEWRKSGANIECRRSAIANANVDRRWTTSGRLGDSFRSNWSPLLRGS